MRFAGFTRGCFYSGALAAPGATPCALGAFDTFGGAISFSAGSFDVFTDPAGFSGISYGAIGNNTPLNSLGTVSSTGPFAAGLSDYLRLRITFTTPIHTGDVNGVAGDNVFDVDYKISGSSAAPGVGGINFIPFGLGLSPALFGVVVDGINAVVRTGNFYTGGFANGDVFPAGPGGGIANGFVNYHTLDTRSVTAGNQATLSSFFQIESTVTGVPEPATLALMGTGLAGLLGVGFLRRRSNDA